MHKTPRSLLGALAALGVPFLASAPALARGGSPCAPVPQGGLVTYDSGFVPAIDAALFGDGSGVVVWVADNTSTGDPSGNAIVGQRINADATPQGTPFVLNTVTEMDQDQLAVAAAPDGRFVAVWTSEFSPEDDENTAIRGRVFAPGGGALGPDFQVNTSTSGAQRTPDVAMADDGTFVVVWYDDSDSSASASRRNGREVRARRFRSDGAPFGPDFVVNDRTDGTQEDPAVAMDPDGRFVVVFETSTGSAGNDTDRAIQARLYDSDGVPEAGQFQVNTTTRERQREPAVAMDRDGSFLVVWKSLSSPGDDQDSNSIQARGFTASGAATGPQRQVNQVVISDQFDPQVAAAGGREFLVVWLSRAVDDRVKARAVDLQAQPLGNEFRAGGSSDQRTQHPAVGGNGAGATITLFERDEQVRGQAYALPCAAVGGATKCTETASNLCLTSGRFRISVLWQNTRGDTGLGRAVELTPDTGYFWFYDEANVETVVKVLDACALNDRYWVFIGGLTDLNVEFEIEDVEQGVVRRYVNPQGAAFLTVNDTGAFDTCR